MRNVISAALAFTFAIFQVLAFAQSNGKLQIHYMDVGQGDGAVLISPGGQVVMFDSGVSGQCDKPIGYLDQLGITEVDYHITSHFHNDHIGCVDDIFKGNGPATLKIAAYDRGGSYPSGDFDRYVSTFKNKRQAAAEDQTIVLDAGSASPVTIKFVALNGNGVSTTNENDLSLVALVEFEGFKAEIGGDLSGEKYGDYDDIETSVADKVGQIDVYKVHHHCSRYSTNKHWLDVTKPTIGIVSAGSPNTHGHPTEDCLERLHAAGVRTYWTTAGGGAAPDPQWDLVVGSVLVEVSRGTGTFTVSYNGHVADQFSIVAGGGGNTTRDTPPVSAGHRFAWSKNSPIFHFAQCPVAKRIKIENLVTSDTEPTDRTKHKNCEEHPN